MLVLDGSYGEGGGQIVRTALSLAALTGIPVRLDNIRARRSKPGLRPQHLAAVQAMARLSRAALNGGSLGSTSLIFTPRDILPGRYSFDVAESVGSAGSVCLVAQTLLPVLAFAPTPSTLILRGGTHVPWSPPAHYLATVFLPTLQAMGLTAHLELQTWGFYPRGGGELTLSIQPASQLQPLTLTAPPAPTDFQVLSAAVNLPVHVAVRQSRAVRDHLAWPLAIREENPTQGGPGSLVFVWGPHAGFSSLGAKGKPAEKVGAEAAWALQSFLATGAALDRHLADQIVLYAALAQGRSTFTTEAITSHLLTNIWVVQQFLGVQFEVQGELGQKGFITVTGAGLRPLSA